jgi:putative heme-binding domain-containing protein
LDEALDVLSDASASRQIQQEYIRAIGDVQADPSRCVPMLLEIIGGQTSAGRGDVVQASRLHQNQDVELATAALVALQRFDAPGVGPALVAMLDRLSQPVRETAESVLASRTHWALDLILAVAEERIDPGTLGNDTVERLRMHNDPELIRLVTQHFPAAEVTKQEYDRRIDVLAGVIRAGHGQPLVGQALFFEKSGCGKCHRMFGQGGDVGPDLTPYNRGNLGHMLRAIVHPSAEIREGYENHVLVTADGQVLTGFKIDENERVLVLRGADGQDRVVAVDAIDNRTVSNRSLMPEGLLDALTDDELRDLFAFLSSTTPPK